ncbi:hypothetical protein B1A99_23100 [Cohnella sp. CIP 111063]|jgi:hypothetical protein|uniref:hypothetical protein n=1 Tax=unclassified Cohnella TaxID=2636738 RepID=UPI000B8C103D|nr:MULTISPECIES: hypothetical protein [unclassified Cohnella]OXS55609.1 hypothetical protein B1A99_23100 [Cohnella sp. CIP 111063]PRX66454.1 hypothetical protein B0G52_116133 [Cohnella sp. SGD-V74]
MSVLRLKWNYLIVFGLIAGLFLPSHSMAQEAEVSPHTIIVTINQIPVYVQQKDPSLIRNKLFFEEKHGFLVQLPGTNATGTVTFYGKKGFIHEVFFW